MPSSNAQSTRSGRPCGASIRGISAETEPPELDVADHEAPRDEGPPRLGYGDVDDGEPGDGGPGGDDDAAAERVPGPVLTAGQFAPLGVETLEGPPVVRWRVGSSGHIEDIGGGRARLSVRPGPTWSSSAEVQPRFTPAGTRAPWRVHSSRSASFLTLCNFGDGACASFDEAQEAAPRSSGECWHGCRLGRYAWKVRHSTDPESFGIGEPEGCVSTDSK